MDKFEMRTKALIVHGGKVQKRGTTIFVTDKERAKYRSRGWATDVEQLTRPTETPEIKTKRQYKRKDMTAESTTAIEPIQPPPEVNTWHFPVRPTEDSDDRKE